MNYNSALLVEAASLAPLVALLAKDGTLEAEVMAMEIEAPTASIWLGGTSVLGTALIDAKGAMSAKVKKAFEALSAKLDAPLIVHQGSDDGLDGVARFAGGKLVGAARVCMFSGEPECVVFRGSKRTVGGEALAEEADDYVQELLEEWAPIELRISKKQKLPVSLAGRAEDSASVTYGWMGDLPTTIGTLKRGKLAWKKPSSKEARAVLAALDGAPPKKKKAPRAKK